MAEGNSGYGWETNFLGSLFGLGGFKGPEKPDIGFEPHYGSFNPESLMKLLEGYRQKETKGIHERAAAKGTYYGAGGTVPGEIELAGQGQMALAQAHMDWQEREQEAKASQYLTYLKAKYGIESQQYKQAHEAYSMKFKETAETGRSVWGDIFSLVKGFF